MKILELFSGYGTASFALKQLGIHYECVGYSDIDRYANQCFQQNHGGKELGDCTKIDPKDLEDFDLLTGGFPCQTFSISGKGKGELDTRGTLFNEIIRIAEVKKPRYMMLENVNGLMSKRHKVTFDKIISELYRIGYFVKWKVINTKEHGIPQNRTRVFFICCRNWNDFCKFEFPKEEKLKIFLKDLLEEDVEEKYFLSEKMVECILTPASEKWQSGKMEIDLDIARPLTATMHKMHRADTDNYISIKNATKKGYLNGRSGDGVSLEHPNSKTRRGRVQQQISATLQCNDAKGVITDDLKIRRLTPTECFRLQGFLDDEVNLDGLSDTQRYRLAGNGQSVNVVRKIFDNLFTTSNLNSGKKK